MLFSLGMQALINDTWASLYQCYATTDPTIRIPDIPMRPYPGKHPGPQPPTSDDLWPGGKVYKNICEDPCRKVREPLPMPKAVPLPWYVPQDPSHDKWWNVGTVIGGAVAGGVIIAGGWTVIVGGGAIEGTGGTVIAGTIGAGGGSSGSAAAAGIGGTIIIGGATAR